MSIKLVMKTGSCYIMLHTRSYKVILDSRFQEMADSVCPSVAKVLKYSTEMQPAHSMYITPDNGMGRIANIVNIHVISKSKVPHLYIKL